MEFDEVCSVKHFHLVAGLGFEPRIVDPESTVMPFHYPAIQLYFTRLGSLG